MFVANIESPARSFSATHIELVALDNEIAAHVTHIAISPNVEYHEILHESMLIEIVSGAP
jgi:hypothetical protein